MPFFRCAPLWKGLASAMRWAVHGRAPPSASLHGFLQGLPKTFYADPQEALQSLRLGRSFNVIYMPMAFKFDFFPARSFPIGIQELDRAVLLGATGISESPAPFVTPEDILLAKLHWFKAGGETSEVQWRDIRGIVRATGARLDRGYLEESAAKLGVTALLESALNEVPGAGA